MTQQLLKVNFWASPKEATVKQLSLCNGYCVMDRVKKEFYFTLPPSTFRSLKARTFLMEDTLMIPTCVEFSLSKSSVFPKPSFILSEVI